MPTYEYYCADCRKSFEVSVALADYGKEVVCPECKGKHVTRQLSTFQAVTRKKS